MKDKGKKLNLKLNLIAANAACILALLIVVFPLLLIAQYNYPSADDWSFSVLSYKALRNGEGIFGMLKGAMEMVKSYRVSWEGRYTIVFLGALQPGIWGERHYGIVAWLMIGGIIAAELFLCRSLLRKWAGDGAKMLAIPIMFPALILQILYTPSPEESFYWYNGSVNYTFVYGLSLILLVVFARMGIADSSKWKYGLRAFVSCILAILIGGGNFSTSLSCLLALTVISALFLWLDRKAFRRTWFVPVLMGAGLTTALLAPGVKVRINASFGGETSMSAGG